jgi:hypothetical protein
MARMHCNIALPQLFVRLRRLIDFIMDGTLTLKKYGFNLVCVSFLTL